MNELNEAIDGAKSNLSDFRESLAGLTETFERLDVSLQAGALRPSRKGMAVFHVAALVVIVSAVVMFLAVVHPGIF